MPIVKKIPFVNMIQYDGTNSAEIRDSFYPYLQTTPQYPFIQSEGGGTLVLALTDVDLGTVTQTMTIGDWISIPPEHSNAGLPSAQVYNSGFPLDLFFLAEVSADSIGAQLLEDEGFVDAIVAEVPAPDPQVLHTAVGRAALPALLLNGTTSPVVVFDQAMPNTNYQIRWRAVAGAAILSSIVANGAVTKTTTQVTVPLRAQGLASVAGVLLVEVFELAES